jgi:adenylate cyclase
LALFGLNTNPQTACRQALQAAALIATNIDELNQFLSRNLLNPIRFGIGIHSGEVIIGDIGYRDHQVFTALGDAVNVGCAPAGHDEGPRIRGHSVRGGLQDSGSTR